jgi:pantoate--beta-alanine ligase
MELHCDIASVRAATSADRFAGREIAFVPTMGALHAGHLTLIRRAREIASRVVVSIYVNPLQFGPKEDFSRYPRDLERDLLLSKETGATDVFAPDTTELMSAGLDITVNPGPQGKTLCGRSRPGHFGGVLTIVAKLFNLVQPTVAVFGWKDAQQLILIRKMVQDLSFPVRVEGVETVRESDGLAMSSRNAYLSAKERSEAPWIHRALASARDCAVAGGEGRATRLSRHAIEQIHANTGARIDYVNVVALDNLRQLKTVEPGNTMIAAAAYFGATRLIDNVRF